MAACSVNAKGLAAATILASMRGIAAQLPWWMAARATASWLREQLLGPHLIPHPTWTLVIDRASALDSILQSQWWVATQPGIATTLQPAAIEARLDAAYRTYTGSVTSGDWKRDFSGKEIWSQVWPRLWPNNTRDGDEMNTVKAVASIQRMQGRVPQELADLRTALRQRVNLPP